jgi:hypothetical protein
MAHKVTKKPAPAAAESDSAADAIAALKPNASVTVAGRAITVREYVYFEGLEVAHRASAFIADLHELAQSGELRYAAARRLFGKHEAVVVEIAARAADVEPEWLRGLKPPDAEKFMSTWFTVNLPFFMREVVVEIQEAAIRLRSTASRSTGSSSVSQGPESATTTSLASDSPSGS